jgi:hypothetical protein
MSVRIVKEKISKEELKNIAQDEFGDMVKAVVDIKREIMAVGGELHADAEQILLADNSNQPDLWGINIYPDKSSEEMVEFSSLINIRPRIGNQSVNIENPEVKKKIISIINKLIV